MFTHMFLGSNDTERSKRFYDGVMSALGFEGGAHPRGWAYHSATQGLIVATPRDGGETAPSNGFTLGFAAPDRAAVDRFHAAGLANGGTCEGPPGIREESPGHMYGAYLRDPDGHKLCAFARAG